jgi:DNA-binding CsgD family transcriptional regulator
VAVRHEPGGGIGVTRRELIGRDDEAAELAELFEARDRLPVGIVLEGEAGIGKTILWRYSVDLARRRSFRVLSCSPVPSESRLLFASLRDLLDEAFDSVAGSLPVPQRVALAVALLREDPGPTEVDPGALAVAFLGALRLLAAEQPLLVAVDDVQWLDPPTRSLLEFAARRLRCEQIALLLAARSAGPEGPVGLSRGLLASGMHRIEVGPLHVGALHAVLRDELDVSFPRPTLLRIHQVSRGNPFFALEIGRAIVQGGDPLTPGEPLPMPDDLSGLVTTRIAQLPPAVSEVLVTVAMLSDPLISLVEAATSPDAPARLREAADLGVVELDETRIRFVHPMLASAALAAAPADVRQRVHRRLAEVAPVAEERTWHLALAEAGPDAAVAMKLDEAARGALARGAPGPAAELSEQARRLTPRELVGDLQRRSVEAATYHLHAGDTGRARVLLEDVLAGGPSDDVRGAGLQGLATVRLRQESFVAAEELLEQALTETEEPRRRAELELNLTVCLFQLGKLDGAAEHGRRSLVLAENLEDWTLASGALTHLAMVEFLLGRGLPADVIGRAVTLAGPGPRRGLPHVLPPEFSWGVMLKWADELEPSRATLEALRLRAEEEHADGWLSAILFHLGELACWLGDFDLAAQYAGDAHRAAEESGSPTLEAGPIYLDAVINAHLGRVDEARSMARHGLAVAERSGNLLHRIRCLAVLGFVDLSLDDPEAACGYLEPAGRLAIAAGCVDPGVLRFLPDEVEALTALGRAEQGGRLLDEFEARARALDRASALAAAGRCRARLLAHHGDLAGALASLERAMVQHERVPMPFERARTLLALGATLRRARQKAAPRAYLAEALDVFERLATPLWAEKARAELARVGGRSPAGVDLTPSERRMADLVAEGRANKEIAAALYVTPKTVETSLSRLYRKLGVHSRTELAHRLAQGP